MTQDRQFNSNRLFGGAGADALDSGSGVNTAGLFAPPPLGLRSISQLVRRVGRCDGDTFTSIENLTGSAYADTLTGNALSNSSVVATATAPWPVERGGVRSDGMGAGQV